MWEVILISLTSACWCRWSLSWVQVVGQAQQNNAYALANIPWFKLVVVNCVCFGFCFLTKKCNQNQTADKASKGEASCILTFGYTNLPGFSPSGNKENKCLDLGLCLGDQEQREGIFAGVSSVLCCLLSFACSDGKLWPGHISASGGKSKAFS